MKYLLICMLAFSVVTTSCCKKIQVVPTIKFTYPLLEKNTTFNINYYLTADSIHKSESFTLAVVGEPHIFPFAVNKAYDSYIIDVYAISFDTTAIDSVLMYSDTISNVEYELKGRCNNKLTDFTFVHNGVFETETEIRK